MQVSCVHIHQAWGIRDVARSSHGRLRATEAEGSPGKVASCRRGIGVNDAIIKRAQITSSSRGCRVIPDHRTVHEQTAVNPSAISVSICVVHQISENNNRKMRE